MVGFSKINITQVRVQAVVGTGMGVVRNVATS